MLIIKVFVNEKQIDEINIHNTGISNKKGQRKAEKYIATWEKYNIAYDEREIKLEGQIDLLDEIFGEFFGIKDLYVDDGLLKSEGKRIG